MFTESVVSCSQGQRHRVINQVIYTEHRLTTHLYTLTFAKTHPPFILNITLKFTSNREWIYSHCINLNRLKGTINTVFHPFIVINRTYCVHFENEFLLLLYEVLSYLFLY